MEITILDIYNIISASLDIRYILACNISTYVLIDSIQGVKGNKVNTGYKRLIAFIFAFIVAILWYFILHVEPSILLGSFFIQFISWDYIFKPILDKFKKHQK